MALAVALATGMIGFAAPAHAETLDHDVSVGVSGITFVTVGTYAVWRVSATNEGTAPTSGPQTITFDYNTPIQPAQPGASHAFSDVHTLGALADDCQVDTAAARVTCVVPALAPQTHETVTIVALTTVAGITTGWTAKVSGDPDDQNPANNINYSANVSFPVAAPQTGPLISDPGNLFAGVRRTSTNGQYTLVMRADGDLVETGNGRTLWSSGTAGNPGSHFTIEQNGDGNIYSADGRVIWTAKSSRVAIPYSEIDITNDGKFYAFDPDGSLWRNQPVGFDTLTASARLEQKQYLHSGSARLMMMPSGDLEETIGTKVVWRSHTDGHPGAVAKLKSDGNLAIYTAGGTPLWSTHTRGTGTGNVLTLSTSGALTLKHGAKTVWRA